MNIKDDWLFKNYKSRGDKDVVILSVHGPDKTHPIIAAYKHSTGWRYESVTNEGMWGADTMRETHYDLVEVQEITVKQVLIWKGTPEGLKNHLSDEKFTAYTNFGDGVQVSETREVIE